MEQIVEKLFLSQLKEKISTLKERGFSYDQIFGTISNGIQYGSIRMKKVKGEKEVNTYQDLRGVIAEVVWVVLLLLYPVVSLR